MGFFNWELARRPPAKPRRRRRERRFAGCKRDRDVCYQNDNTNRYARPSPNIFGTVAISPTLLPEGDRATEPWGSRPPPVALAIESIDRIQSGADLVFFNSGGVSARMRVGFCELL